MKAVRITTAILLGLGLSAGTLAIATPATAAPRTSVNHCGQLEVKPADLVLSCADASTMLTDLRWTRWSNGSAKATGSYEVNDCSPTCVAGTTREYRAKVTLSVPKVQAGKRVFTKATITFTKAGPNGRRAITWRSGTYAPQSSTPAAAPSSAASSPAPSTSATPAPAASTAAPSASATAKATATPTVAAIAAPTAILQKSEVFQTSKLRLSITADSKAGGDRQGIRSITVYRPNEENAELPTKASYVGDETANKNEWTALLSCDRSGASKDTLRIVVTANDGQTTTLREKVQPTFC